MLFLEGCVGTKVEEAINNAPAGSVVLLENLRLVLLSTYDALISTNCSDITCTLECFAVQLFSSQVSCRRGGFVCW